MLPYHRFHALFVCLGYLFVYVAVMRTLILWYSVPGLSANPLKSLDMEIYSVLSQWKSEAPELDPRLLLIDLPYFENGDLVGYRENLGNLLHYLASMKSDGPRVVVLDIAIQSDNRGLETLRDGLSTLADNAKIYAAVDPRKENSSDDLDSKYLERFDKKTYRELLDGYGHTLMMLYGSMLLYDREVVFEDGQRLPALAVKVVEDKDDDHRYGLREGSSIIVPLGREELVATQTWTALFRDDGGVYFQHWRQPTLIETPAFKNKYVIVGSLEKDSDNHLKRPGPELLAWALNDLLYLDTPNNPRSHAQVLDNQLWLIVGMLVFGGLSLFFFRAQRNSRLPFVLMVAGALFLSLGLLALITVLLLQINKTIFPQLSLIAVSILTTVSLAALHHFRQQRRAAWETDMASLMHRQAECYDVFISYSRRPPENLEWVKTHVYEPLCRARKADGTPLRIFFDTESIKVGISWHQKLIDAIEKSRFFVPVCSEEYFQSDYCLLEMERAAIKRDHQHDFILPLRRNLSEIPVEYTHIQFENVITHPDFIHKILTTVLAVDL